LTVSGLSSNIYDTTSLIINISGLTYPTVANIYETTYKARNYSGIENINQINRVKSITIM
jgi:hypothetical protein